jgi:hypothetical protein
LAIRQFDLPNRIGDSNSPIRFAGSICLIDLPNPLGKSICQIHLANRFGDSARISNSSWRFYLANRFAGSILQIDLQIDLPDPFAC